LQPVCCTGAARFFDCSRSGVRLSVSTATVYKLCARGELAYVRIFGAIRVAPDDLVAVVALRRTTPAS